jgi:hypothetical protein
MRSRQPQYRIGFWWSARSDSALPHRTIAHIYMGVIAEHVHNRANSTCIERDEVAALLGTSASASRRAEGMLSQG